MVTRRKALVMINGALGCALGAAVTVPVAGVVLDPVLRKGRQGSLDLVDIGALEDFPVGQTSPAVASQEKRDAWVRYPAEPTMGLFVIRSEDGSLEVFSRVCPHLGCSINEHTKNDGFYCPCHGSAFGVDGTRLELDGAPNPSPRDMDRMEHEIKDGRVMVRVVHYRTGTSEQEAVS